MGGLSNRYDADLHYYEQQIRLYPFLKDQDRTNWTAKRVNMHTCLGGVSSLQQRAFDKSTRHPAYSIIRAI